MGAGVCNWCGESKKLIDAHIVPRAFYPKTTDIRISSLESERESRSRKGIYDQTILCRECDSHFGKFDDYAARVLRPAPRRKDLLRNEAGFISKGDETRYRAYWIRNPDVRKLQGFCASLIWRAGVTSRYEMSLQVSNEVLLRCKRVVEGDEESFFDVIGMRCDEDKLSEFVARPTIHNEHDAPGYQFYMGGVILSIFGRAPANIQDMSPLILGRERDWLIGFVPFWGSKFETTIREIYSRKANMSS